MPGHAYLMLAVVSAIAIGCLLISDLSAFSRNVLFGALVLEVLHGIHRIRSFRPFTLNRDRNGCFLMNQGTVPMPVSDVRWQDFGYLAVMHYSRQGTPGSALWWLGRMPEPQRRQLRLWMNDSATAKTPELPSILVNPVI
jgi:hypothetical protein